jgi:hypothetical protein
MGKQIIGIDIGYVKPFFQQDAIHFCMPVGKMGTPYPGVAGKGFGRLDIKSLHRVQFEFHLFKTFPPGDLSFPNGLSLHLKKET